MRVGVLSAPGGTAGVQLPQGGEVRSPRDGPQAAGFPVVVPPGGSVVLRYDGSYHVSGATVQGRAASTAQCIPILGPCPTTTTAPPDSGGGGGDTGGGGGGGDGGALRAARVRPDDRAADDPGPAGDDGDHRARRRRHHDDDRPGPTTATTAPAGRRGRVVEPGCGSCRAVAGSSACRPRQRSYRGAIEAVGGGGIRFVNELDVETYLKGMGEVPSSWPLAAQQAQAVAARTYVLRAMAASGEVCDYDRCQVYIGATREAPGQSEAVDTTRGMVLTYGGQLAATVYSADAGGVTATTLEGFGTPDGVYPYLRSAPYDTPDPLPWTLDVGLDDLARRFRYGGSITGVRISQAGPSGRALEVTLDGSAGPLAIPGRQFASSLGLRSTLFTPRVGDAAAAPAPLPAAGADTFAVQALPDDAEALSDAVADTPTPRSASDDDADAPSAAEQAAGIDLDDAGRNAAGAAGDLARSPMLLGALAALGAATAFGMARLGGLQPIGVDSGGGGVLLAGLRPTIAWPIREGRRPSRHDAPAPVVEPPPPPEPALAAPSRPRRTRPLTSDRRPPTD